MAVDHIIPVIIGVSDVKNKSNAVEDAIEPMQLMLQAILSAINDIDIASSQTKQLQSNIDSIDVVATWTWPYHDLPGLLAKVLGVQPTHKHYSKHGGHHPMKLVDEAARRIAQGRSTVAVVTGGEALASLSACRAAKKLPAPGWTMPDHSPPTAPLELGQFGGSIGNTHAISLPAQIYALYENSFRAHRGQTIEQNNTESAKMYAEFAKIAEGNKYAWSHGQPAATENEICTVSKSNRMICFPYPLLMNAFNSVNLAAACILTSTRYARELGVPDSRWIYPLGGAGTQDADNFWERPNFHSSPSISRSLDAALEVAGLSKEQIDLFDFYSCFPIVPKLACHHLGLPSITPPKPITLLGGLTSFGGAGNNYSLHALTAMVRQLRNRGGLNGLILANGGVLTHQHALCLSTQPRKSSTLAYPPENPLPESVTDLRVPSVIAEAEGEAIVETYTVDFDRQGAPAKGFVIGRLSSEPETRFVANAGDAKTLEQLVSRTKEPIGRLGWVSGDGNGNGRNLFVFDRGANL